MRPLTIIALVIGGLMLAAAIVIGGYQLGWWLKAENTDRQVNIDNRNTGTQTAWHDEATSLINQASLLPDNAPQRARLEQQACELIDRLTDPYVDDNLAAYQAQECQ
jgi:hypothetical protein